MIKIIDNLPEKNHVESKSRNHLHVTEEFNMKIKHPDQFQPLNSVEFGPASLITLTADFQTSRKTIIERDEFYIEELVEMEREFEGRGLKKFFEFFETKYLSNPFIRMSYSLNVTRQIWMLFIEIDVKKLRRLKLLAKSLITWTRRSKFSM